MDKGKTLLAVIFAASLVSAAFAVKEIIDVYKIEKELRELKAEAEELVEAIPITTPAQLPKPIKRVPIQAKEEEIAPVQTEETFIPHDEIPLADEYQEWIESECKRMEVNAAYIYALIESESSFRTGLCVKDGGGHSAGLCQINSVNWPDMEKKGLDPLDEFDNITYCISLISKYLNKYSDAEDIVNTITTCYKAGERRAKELNYHLSSCEYIKERMAYYSELLNKED